MIGKQVAVLPTPPSDLLQRLNTAYELLEAAWLIVLLLIWKAIA